MSLKSGRRRGKEESLERDGTVEESSERCSLASFCDAKGARS